MSGPTIDRTIKVKTQQPGEDLIYDFDFGPKLPTGVTLSSPQASQWKWNAATDQWETSNQLTLGTPALSEAIYQMRVTGGLDGESFHVEIAATGSNDEKYQVGGMIRFVDQPSPQG